MSAKRSCSFRIGILTFSLLSSVASADPAEDLASAEKAFNSDNLSLTMDLLMKASKEGYAPAQARLGELLDASEYDKDAVEWYRKAAEQGNASGQYHLGNMYALGEGIEKDFVKALYWFGRAAENNHLPAVRFLANAYKTGSAGLAIDLDRAKLWDDRANLLEAAAKAKKGNAVKKSPAESKPSERK